MVSRKIITILFVFSFFVGNSQLNEVKILIPKEVTFAMSDFTQFLPGEKYFVVLANSISVFNTETAEIIDDYELNIGAKNLSISKDGKYILATVNAELFIFSFSDLKLKLVHKLTSADMIKGQPNSEYYGALPITGAFFTDKPDVIYACIGSFTMLYDLNTKSVVSSYNFPIQEYMVHAVKYAKTGEAILARTQGTINTILKQSLTDLTKTSVVATHKNVAYKLRLCDSLLFCFNTDELVTYDLTKGKVIHEIKAPVFEYSKETDNEYTRAANVRNPIIKYDDVNFEKDEFAYDADLILKSGTVIYSTSKGLKFIDLKTKKLVKFVKYMAMNIRVSSSGNRMISNGFTTYKAVRVHDPNDMKLVCERLAMGHPIYFTNISPGNKWLFTGSVNSGFLWDLSNYTKYAEIKDISKSDSSFIYNVYFLSDTEMVVNGGKDYKNMGLYIYNIPKKKYTRRIKQGIYTFASGFMNGEYYYTETNTLHIIDLKTMKEETYEGLFSLAASPLYRVIEFNNDVLFVPEAGKFKVIKRRTKEVVYESEAWGISTRVKLSEDGKNLFTIAQIKKMQDINGNQVEIPTSALVKIDLTQKKVVNDYAQTYNLYDFKLKEGGKKIEAWYVKHEFGKYDNKDKETVYSEYEVETGKETKNKTLVKTPQMVTFNFASENGKYFALQETNGFFKIFDSNGDELIDLSDMKITMPKCFFDEEREMLIVTTQLNSLATFVDLKAKKIMGQMANAGGDDYFMVTSDLDYLGSKEFIKSIRFKYKSEMFSFDQFDAYLNRPHKVLRAFKCSDSALVHAYEAAYQKRMRVLGMKADTKLNFSVLPSIQNVVMKDDKAGKVKFEISANKGVSDLNELTIINNGTIVHTEKIKKESAARYEGSFSFESTSGVNRFEFIIKDDKGLEAPRITRFYNNTNENKPDLYLVVIASEKFKNSDFDLNYALKDASDVAATMANSKAFKNTYIKKISNVNFGTDSVIALKKFFERAGVNDLALVFYAGHGYLDTDLSYYFPTYYTNFDDPKINSVAYTNFEKIFSEMKPIKKLMFIDACFSGEVDVDATPGEEKKMNKGNERSATSMIFSQSTALEMSKAVFTDLRQHSGVTVISSAGGTEEAFEDDAWKNGLFTYCLLNGMKNFKADANRDSKVTLNELQKFVSEEVKRLSNGKQTPTYRVENTVLDYELW
jgi:WD40 repeat protein